MQNMFGKQLCLTTCNTCNNLSCNAFKQEREISQEIRLIEWAWFFPSAVEITMYQFLSITYMLLPGTFHPRSRYFPLCTSSQLLQACHPPAKIKTKMRDRGFRPIYNRIAINSICTQEQQILLNVLKITLKFISHWQLMSVDQSSDINLHIRTVKNVSFF